MKKLTILAAGLSTLIAAPVMAGGVAEPAPAPVMTQPAPMATSMSWTGGSVGVQLGYADVSTNVAGLDGDGALLGLRAYYDYDFGNFIVGGGLQYDGSNIDLGGVDVDSVTRAGLRAGVDLGQSWVYGTGGWANVQTSGALDDDSDGWFAGVGYERFITDNMTVGAEVLRHEFDEFDAAGVEADATSAAVSVNFRF
jgi:outer membrane immunogenic protein